MLETANLYVGGFLVQSWSRQPTDIPVQEKHLGVMFDSSHFAPNTMLHVRITATDNLGRFYDSDVDDPSPNDAQVRNWACLYGRYDMEIHFLTWHNGEWYQAPGGDETPFRGLPSSSSRLPGMNYLINRQVTTIGWDAADFCEDAMVGNVIHLRSHATPSAVWSDSNDYWFEYSPSPPGPGIQPLKSIYGVSVPPNAPSGSTAVFPYRVIANGMELPPFNSTGLPPVNIAFIYGCSTAADNAIAEGMLYPYGNSYVGVSAFPENQACVGTNDSVISSQARNVHEAFWGALEDGAIAHIARIEAYLAYTEKKPDTPQEFMRVWGDFFASLKGVYDPLLANETPDGWFRPL